LCIVASLFDNGYFCQMANSEHIAKLQEGVEAWNKWRAENPDNKYTDLNYADLIQIQLLNANLAGARLRSAVLAFAFVSEANLVGAALRAANLIPATPWLLRSKAPYSDARNSMEPI
jgi:uncharacterized protein YjbI with pentapeptide repeats